MATIVSRIKDAFGRLGKTAQRAVLLALALSVAGGVALAAWQLTKQTTGEGLVMYTFSLDELTCTSLPPLAAEPLTADWATCSVVITNLYDAPVSVIDAVLGCEAPGIVLRGGFFSEDSSPDNIPPGGTATVMSKWYPSLEAEEGAVPFTMDVTVAED